MELDAGTGARARIPAYGLTLAPVAAILAADNVFSFLLAWEGLTIGFYLLTAHGGRTEAAIVTVMFGKISGAALLIGMLLLAAKADSFALLAFASLPSSGTRDAAYALLVLGFATDRSGATASMSPETSPSEDQ
ncbi:proton-conducting transporter membrane subunit [Kribbella catacumbae]|uniref:proton-conducting transporter transmembrane domain-containing protein n=1 Tax=Kribbella catacumbae TaxID=460086 RepID=UPI000361C046|nr:proton-conducting transporter membrane subunit [Kribbella catacumbae]